jgi:hypothetical protein
MASSEIDTLVRTKAREDFLSRVMSAAVHAIKQASRASRQAQRALDRKLFQLFSEDTGITVWCHDYLLEYWGAKR